MGLFSFLRKKPKTIWDEIENNPAFREQRALFEAMKNLCEDGVDADELPGGNGEYGYSPSNPIPCHTVFGTTSFLAHLRILDGSRIRYERIGSQTSDISQYPIDAYRISSENGTEVAVLYFSPYQKRNSHRPPRNFHLDNMV
jgi:hypothetical protein